MKTSFTLRFAAAAVAAIAAIACSKVDTAEPGNPDSAAPFTITASIDEGSDTRISMTDDGVNKIELKWQSDDKIYVANEGSTSAYEFSIVAGSISSNGKTAAFQAPAGYSGTPLYAVHERYGYFASLDPTNLHASYLTQYASYASALASDFRLYARYDAATGQFAFRPLIAILKLGITLPEGASGVASHMRITATDDSKVFYDGSYDISGESPVRTNSAFTDEILFSGNTHMTAGTEQSLYIPIHPGTELAGKELEISIVVGIGVYTATITASNLVAGKCYPLAIGAAKWTHVGNVAEAGAGIASDPYRVRTERNLKALAKAVLTGQSYGSTYFQLENSIMLATTADQPWHPIGRGSKYFSGHFDGNNQTLSGDIHLSNKYGRHLGLFGYIYEGSVSNLTVNGDIIYSSSEALSGTLEIGAIGGHLQGDLTGCTHNGAMTLENTVYTGLTYVGGIAGYSEREISGCTQQGGTITVNMPRATIYAGGIVGVLSYLIITDPGTMHTCINKSDISLTGATSVYAGTLAGRNEGAIYECSTAQPGLTVTVNSTPQNPVKAVGNGYDPVTCDKGHTAQE